MGDSQVSITLDFPITEANTRLARDMLERAVRLDPNAIDAAVWLADLTMSDYLNVWNGAGPAELVAATAIVTRVLALPNPPTLAHYVQGFIHRASGHHIQARDSFRRARTIDPEFARAIAHEGAQTIMLGDWAAGRQLVDQAIVKAPNSPSLGVFHYMKGRAFLFEGLAGDKTKFADAIECLEQSRHKRDNLWYNWAYLIAAYHLAGNTAQARTELAGFRAAHGTQIKVPDHIRERLEARNPNGDAHAAVIAGRDGFLRAIKEIW